MSRPLWEWGSTGNPGKHKPEHALSAAPRGSEEVRRTLIEKDRGTNPCFKEDLPLPKQQAQSRQDTACGTPSAPSPPRGAPGVRIPSAGSGSARGHRKPARPVPTDLSPGGQPRVKRAGGRGSRDVPPTRSRHRSCASAAALSALLCGGDGAAGPEVRVPGLRGEELPRSSRAL